MVKIQPFSLVFSLKDSIARDTLLVIPLEFQKKINKNKKIRLCHRKRLMLYFLEIPKK